MDSQRIIKRNEWVRYFASIPGAQEGKKVKTVSFNLKAKDFLGNVNITDLQLQSGNQVTVQMPHTTEILEGKKYGINENVLYTAFSTTPITNGKKKGNAQPKIYTGLKNRMFNIAGRGHETIALPNVFNEDYKVELLTSGLDLELYAKEDYDWLRISTNDGALISGRAYDHPKLIDTHPLNWKYSREFYMDGGKANQKISLSTSLMEAFNDTANYQFGQRALGVNDSRQRFMMAPWGSFRIRIEFYKYDYVNLGTDKDPDYQYYLRDVGIGFYGTAQFTHVRENHTNSGARVTF